MLMFVHAFILTVFIALPSHNLTNSKFIIQSADGACPHRVLEGERPREPHNGGARGAQARPHAFRTRTRTRLTGTFALQ